MLSGQKQNKNNKVKMKHFLVLIFVLPFIFSCGPNNREEKMKHYQDSLEAALQMQKEQEAQKQQAYYLNRDRVFKSFHELEEKKGFAFYCVESCQDNSKVYYDASKDVNRNAHQIGIYRDEDSLYVGFSVFVDCYSEFVADYKNEKDTLRLFYSLMNPGYHDCYCNYRWQFAVKNKNSNYDVITLNGKQIRDE